MPTAIPPMYESVRNGTNGKADFLWNFFRISIKAANRAAPEKAVSSTVSIFQNPRNPPMNRIRMLSPYPKDSSVILLMIRNITPVHAPAARRIIETSLPQKSPAAVRKAPESRTGRLSCFHLISITARTTVYPANNI